MKIFENKDNVVTTISSSPLLLSANVVTASCNDATTTTASMSTAVDSPTQQQQQHQILSNSHQQQQQQQPQHLHHHHHQQQQQQHHQQQQQQQQQQQPQYHYITTTGDDGQTPTTIVFENYSNNTNGNGIDIDTPTTTIVKVETEDNNFEEYEIVCSAQNAPSTDNGDSNSITTTAADADIMPSLGATEAAPKTTNPSNNTAIRITNVQGNIRGTGKKATRKRTTLAQHLQQEQQEQQDSYESVINQSDDGNNQAMSSSGNESIMMVPKIPSVKQKRKRKTRIISDDEQGEYLEKMSVRGLDIHRYEHIIDGVSYCLVCAKNDIYKTFKNKYSFQRHAYLFHEGENRKIFACPICNKEFSRPDKMKMHKKDKHGDMPVPDSTNGIGAENAKNNSNGGTPNITKRARNSTAGTKTPRARKRPNTTNINNINDSIDNNSGNNDLNKIGQNGSSAKNKRLAQIDSVLDEVQNADSNNSNKGMVTTTTTTIIHNNNNNTQQQQQQQQLINDQQQRQQQQLPSIDLSGMILPGGAQLALANPGATSNIQITNHHRSQLLQATTPNNNGPTLIYANQLDLPQALLQQQLQHGQSQIMIQDQAGNLVPLQSLTTTLDSNGQTIYTTTPVTQHQQQQQQSQLLQTQQQQQQQPQQQQQLITLTPQQLKLQQQNNVQHQSQNHNQQQNYELENVSYLSTTAATPAPTEHQVIGTVQSYQILTPDGLQNYQTAAGIKTEPSDFAELCPYSSALGTTTPQYTFSTHGGHHTLTATSDPLFHQHHTTQHQTQHHHHGHSHGQQQSTHGSSVLQQQHQQHQQQQQHPHFMELKNDLLLKSATDAYTLDASSMYHLPFSPTSMINAVNDVNSSSLLETKEIR